jgi:hypothetical protein
MYSRERARPRRSPLGEWASRPAPRAHGRIRYGSKWPAVRGGAQRLSAALADDLAGLEAGPRGDVHRGGRGVASGTVAVRPTARGGVDVAQPGSAADGRGRLGGPLGGGPSQDLRQVPRWRHGGDSSEGRGGPGPPGRRPNLGTYLAWTAVDGRFSSDTAGHPRSDPGSEMPGQRGVFAGQDWSPAGFEPAPPPLEGE